MGEFNHWPSSEFINDSEQCKALHNRYNRKVTGYDLTILLQVRNSVCMYPLIEVLLVEIDYHQIKKSETFCAIGFENSLILFTMKI